VYSRIKTLSDSEKYKQHIVQAKDVDHDLIEDVLILSKERIEELKILKKEQMQITKNDFSNQYIFTWKNQDHHMVAYAEWNQTHQGYQVTDKNGQVITVLGRNINGKFLPITSDYDLLMIGFKRDEWHTTLDDHQHHPCERVKKIIQIINHDIYENDPNRKLTAEPIVQHDQEVHNPIGGEIHDDFPCLFVLPDAIKGILNLQNRKIDLSHQKNRVLLIENLTELNLLYQLVTNHDNNFYLPSHPKYWYSSTTEL
jgi:hypothetical protein